MVTFELGTGGGGAAQVQSTNRCCRFGRRGQQVQRPCGRASFAFHKRQRDSVAGTGVEPGFKYVLGRIMEFKLHPKGTLGSHCRFQVGEE